MRARVTAAKMGQLVARWRESGEPQAGFARRHGIPPWTFWYWCRKLATVPAPAPDVFVPLHVAPDEATPVLEVVLRSGDRLHVRPGASADLLQMTLAALRAGC